MFKGRSTPAVAEPLWSAAVSAIGLAAIGLAAIGLAAIDLSKDARIGLGCDRSGAGRSG
jgi:hypothetical protein